MRSSASLPVSGGWTAIASSGATTTSHTVASLTNGTRYYFQIRATNANGNSSASNTATIQLAASPPTAVSITDANLRTALETAMGKAAGATITQLDMAKLTRFSSSRISNISGLEYAVNTRWLSLSFGSISDLTPLAGLTSLTWLYLFQNSISGVTPLAGLTSLRSLNLSDNRISDPSPLAPLTSLTSLWLQGNPISSFSDVPLASFSSLTLLGLSGRWITDSLLASLAADYPMLNGLFLTDGSVTDLTPLAGITSLELLDLSHNSISDLSPLRSLTSIRDLYLDDNSISNLSPLSSLASLDTLDITRNAISDLSPLVGLPSLAYLTADRNPISDLSPLSGLTSLVSLGMQGTWLSDLTPLVGLPSLSELYLHSNLISDVAPLTNAALASGSYVDLGANPLSQASVTAHIPTLVDRGVTVDHWGLPDTVPARPRLLIGRTQSTGAATIRWRDPADQLIARYEIRRAAGPAPAGSAFDEWSPIAGSNKRTTDHAVYVPEDGWHTFEVRAVNAVGDGPAARFQLLVGANNAPTATKSINDASLARGERLAMDVAGYFSDPDFTDTLTFSAASSRPAVATAQLDGSALTVTAVAEGQARITVRAEDTHGATASLSFLITVGNPVSIGGGDATSVEVAAASAPEGGVAEVTVAMAEPREEDISFAYSFGPDSDPATADADAADHGGEGGTVTIAAGETEATIRIPIADDDDIEPAREAFLVALQPLDGAGLANSSAIVHIEEGVCDRTWQVADALRDGHTCEAMTPAELERRRVVRLADAGLAELKPLDFLDLAGMRVLILDGNGLSALPERLLAGSPGLRVLRLRGNRFETLPVLGSAPALIELDLAGNLLTELPASPFENLPALGYLYLGGNGIEALPADLLAEAAGLRILELQDNALEALPEGLFAGVSKLFSLQLQGSPGAPFFLPLELARVEAEAEAEGEGAGEDEEEPGRATIQLRMPHAAPFAVSVELSAPGATLSTQMATIAAGDTLGDPVSVVRSVAGNEADAAVTVEIASAPSLPTTACGDDYDEYRCFRGFELTPGSPLTLFEPPAAADVPKMR